MPIISTAIGEMSGLSPRSIGGVVYTSTPFTPFYPPCSVPSTFVPGLVEQCLQTQQPTSVLPVVSVGNFVGRSDCLPFTAVTASSPSTMPYVPSATQQLPISGSQANLMPTGNCQQLSSSILDQVSTDSALLKRVTIPKFFGQKKNYETWKAAFYSCVDRTKASPEYKLLSLRECLQGEALKVIKHLGHSVAAYAAAKSRLERKYGGKRRALTLRLEELDAFKPIREDNEKGLEKFSELLDGIVVNLKDANQEAKLGNGSLYITLQRKFNNGLLSKYKQWISDNHRIENVGTLRDFVDRESEFLTTASETITDYFNYVFAPYIARQLETVQRVDVVWDVYHEDSLKRCKREKRGYGRRRKVLASTRIPSDWKGFLRVDGNKDELFKLLAEKVMLLINTQTLRDSVFAGKIPEPTVPLSCSILCVHRHTDRSRNNV